VFVSVTSLYIPFKHKFEPLVLPLENIAIPISKNEFRYFKVLYVEPVQPIIITESLSALEKNREHELSEIKLEDNQAGQWRMWLLDYVAVKMRFPRATAKWVTRETETFAQPLSMAKEQILEFYTWKDEVPVLYLDNPVNEDQLVRILVWGFKYAVEELKRPPEKYTVFPVYSLEYVIGGRR